MINIIFKDVGHGDSIIIEWFNENGEKEVGVIDCNLKGESNPVLSHIQGISLQSISFILLTHPHYDHYSGLRQLLEYCEQSGIIISRFLHTAHQVPEYLMSAVKSSLAKKELVSLFKKIQGLWEAGTIEYQSYVNIDRKDLSLNNEISIRFLSPSVEEDSKYLKSIKPFTEEEEPFNKAKANWLSSVLKIYSEDWYVLLTSDVERSVLKKLGIDYHTEFREELFLCQAPHHGAWGNHYRSFWRHRNPDKKNVPVVFSAGENSYNHPSKQALDDLSKYGFEIYSTNVVGNLAELTKEEQRYIDTIEASLNIFSDEIEKDNALTKLEGDKSFEITREGHVIPF